MVENGENSPQSDGGAVGGSQGEPVYLSRSEIALLGRTLKDDDFLYTPDEKRHTVVTLLNVMDTSRSNRIKIAAAKALIQADRNNVGRQRNKVIQDRPPELPRQVVINYNNLSLQELEQLESLAQKAGVIEVTHDGDGSEPSDANASVTS